MTAILKFGYPGAPTEKIFRGNAGQNAELGLGVGLGLGLDYKVEL